MGTLTADCPRLDAHCPHKLATSCRLTSTPNCCACADERAHSRTYRVYIDGIGFVQRGTRWQGYCWFCKEFWTNRLAATDPPLTISETRIPEIPDQTEFLERWNEFHQGYRVAKLQDGTEQRMPVIGEPFKEVSPGFLPRTLDQLRAGIMNDARRPENRLRRERLASEDEEQAQPQQSLDSALDSLLEEAENETSHLPQDTETPSMDTTQPTSRSTPSTLPLNRIEARIQRRREQFARTFGTREELQREDYESPISTFFNRADGRYRQAEELRATGTTSPPPLDGLSAQERREIEEQLLWGVMRDSAAHHELEAENNVWSYAPRREQASGTAESSRARVLRHIAERSRSPGAEHDSFANLMPDEPQPHRPRRHVDAEREEALRVIRSRNLSRAMAASSPNNRSASPTSRTRSSRSPMASGPLFHFGTPRTTTQNRNDDFDHLRRQFELIEAQERELARNGSLPQQSSAAAGPSSEGNGMSQVQTSISQITSELQRLRLASEAITSARHSMHARFVPPEQPAQTLDNQPDRPPPLTDEEMTKTLACQVCYQQLADVALLPCGHMCMCQWCADVVIPVKHSHLPVRASKCPMCRKAVKQRFKIHM